MRIKRFLVETTTGDNGQIFKSGIITFGNNFTVTTALPDNWDSLTAIEQMTWAQEWLDDHLTQYIYKNGNVIYPDQVEQDSAITGIGNLPGWANWTATEAANYISTNVLGGMTREQVESWVDTNVSNLAQAKTALKLLGDELIDLREICENMARAIMFLRDISLK